MRCYMRLSNVTGLDKTAIMKLVGSLGCWDDVYQDVLKDIFKIISLGYFQDDYVTFLMDRGGDAAGETATELFNQLKAEKMLG